MRTNTRNTETMIPQEIIDAAPDEPETLAKHRKTLTDCVKKLARSRRDIPEWKVRSWVTCRNAAEAITLALEPFGKITFQFGPTRYTVWNTKQNLEALNKRLKANKKLFPKP